VVIRADVRDCSEDFWALGLGNIEGELVFDEGFIEGFPDFLELVFGFCAGFEDVIEDFTEDFGVFIDV